MFPGNESLFPGIPNIEGLHGGSDHKYFFDYLGKYCVEWIIFEFSSNLGIPAIDFQSADPVTLADWYPLYHTMYETAFYNEHLLDTNHFAVST